MIQLQTAVATATFICGLGLGGLVSGCTSTGTRPLDSASSANTGSRVGASASAVGSSSPHPFPSGSNPTLPTAAVKGHPRLWLTAEDLPRLRSWAVAANPIYGRGLAAVAQRAKADMDAGKIPSQGRCESGGKYCESYALLFAFMSLVNPQPAKRQDYAQRARKILMHMMKRVAAGDQGDPLAKKRFSLSDRSRWAGEAFGLTVDWIYPHLSTADKATIRQVFLRWAEQQLHAQTTNHNHPEPIGKLNDPVLVKKRAARRYAANNYFTAHMRNLGLMAMALDEADDPADPNAGRTYPRLRDYLQNATGAWLYMTNHVLANDAIGGWSPEGFEYAPRSLAFTIQFHWALQTAGQADPTRYGPQVVVGNNPFWKQVIPAYLHGLSPATVQHNRIPVYQPAWTGDGETYELLDFIDVFAPLGLHAERRGDQKTLAAVRWLQIHTPAGGSGDILRRARARNGALGYRQSILYFMLMAPGASPLVDPRPKVGLSYLGRGLGQIFARTSWGTDASWFTYQVGWADIDHQHGDANNFGFYRRGEWLTKERVGYGEHFENTDQHNAVCIENDQPRHSSDTRRAGFWKRGSQWVLSHAADPQLLAHSFATKYVYASGDATGMYNSDYEGVRDVKHASRAVFWLKPDHLVVYDRAVTGKADRFKRFWLHTPAVATVNGQRATVTTKKGQQLFIQTLLPASASIKAQAYTPGSDWRTKPAAHEPMTADLLVEPAHSSREVRFLHVLQGADRKGRADPVALVKSTGSTVFEGARIGTAVVLFPVRLGSIKELVFTVPSKVSRLYLTGLEPGKRYDVSKQAVGAKVEFTVKPGTARAADSGGVLVF